MLYALIGIIVVIIDQAAKFWVSENIISAAIMNVPEGYTNSIEIIPKVLSLVNVQNKGTLFGIFSGSEARISFIILTGVFCFAVVIVLATNLVSGRFGRWCLVLTAAGAFSNCIDRIIYGYLQEIFRVELFNFAVFNIADVVMLLFMLLFIIYLLFGGERRREPEDEFDEDKDDDREEQRLLFAKRRNELPIDERNSVPVNRPTPPQRKRRDIRRDEYEQYKSERAEREKAHAARQEEISERQRAAAPRPAAPTQRRRAVPPPPPPMDPQDPFAEWERANSAAKNSRPPLFNVSPAPESPVSGAERARAVQSELGFDSAPVQPKASPRRTPVSFEQPFDSGFPSAANPPAPERKANIGYTPPPAVDAGHAPAKTKEEFSLDDILKEFMD